LGSWCIRDWSRNRGGRFGFRDDGPSLGFRTIGRGTIEPRGRLRIGCEKRSPPGFDGLGPIVDVDGQCAVYGREKALTIGADGDVLCWREVVLDHSRWCVRRAFAGDGMVECCTECVDVGPGALLGRLARVLLRRGVARLDDGRDAAGLLT